MVDGYSRFFYGRHEEGSADSAALVAPLLMDLLDPRTVIDVGCGVGTWLEAFARLGVPRVLGLDGDHVPRDRLRIEPADFHPTDLAEPFGVDERFDLALSLEVAEHLPEAAAAGFVAALTRLSDVVLFSAAIPGQGGDHHVNERWPSYWAALFAHHGYRPIDCVRSRIWNEPAVGWWYAQNIILYAAPAALERSARLKELETSYGGVPLDLVHPRRFLLDQSPSDIPVRRALSLLLSALRRKLGLQSRL